MPVDPSVFNLANNPGSFGPDLKQIFTLQSLAQQMQARKMVMDQEQQGQNALRQVFSNPENIGPGGFPTPNALGQIARSAPQLYTELLPVIGQAQERQARAQVVQGKLHEQWMSDRYKSAKAAETVYTETLPQGEEAARKAGQEMWQSGLDAARQSGLYPPELVDSVPKQFPTDVGGLRAKLRGYEAGQAKPETQAQEEQNKISRERLELDKGKSRRTDFRGALDKPESVDVVQPDGTKKRMSAAWDKDNRRWVTTDGTSTTIEGEVIPASKSGTGASAGEPLDDETVNYWARRVDQGEPLPSAYRDAESRKRIMTAVAKLHPETPATDAAGESIARKAELKSNTAALTQINKIATAAEAYEDTALKNIDIVKEKLPAGIGPTKMPLFDRWIQTGRIEAGNAAVPPYETALVTVANEYAKVMSGSTGAQGSTVDARKEAAELLNKAQNKEQVLGVLDVMKRDMENKKAAYNDERSKIRGRIAGAGGPPASTPIVHASMDEAIANKQWADAKSGTQFVNEAGEVIATKP